MCRVSGGGTLSHSEQNYHLFHGQWNYYNRPFPTTQPPLSSYIRPSTIFIALIRFYYLVYLGDYLHII